LDGLLDAVGDEDDGGLSFKPKCLEILADAFPGHGIQFAEWLVQKQCVRLMDQRLTEGGTLLHAAGKFGWQAMLEAVQMHFVQKISNFFAVVVERQAAHFELDFDIALHRAPGHQRIVLEHDADIGLRPVDRLPIDENVTLAALKKASHHQHHGRLAAARRAQKRDELTRLNVEIGGAEGMYSLRPLTECFLD